MADSASAKLRWSLKSLGLSDQVIHAAWPEWWSEAADSSASARAELRFSVSRKLGLDPNSLSDNEQPRFIWNDEGKFKRLTTESPSERAAIVSFGVSVARALIASIAPGPPILGATAAEFRKSILNSQPFVRLIDVIALSWAVGIPVIHLRVFPLPAKRMSAMVLKVDGRFAVLLAKDANYPAPIAFYLAHELGHIALGHLSEDVALIDYGDTLQDSDPDQDEHAADRFGLELLTGMPSPTILPEATNYNAASLAQAILRSAPELGIEPGTMALCFGHSNSAWEKAFAAMKAIYTTEQPVWAEVNKIAAAQLNWEAMPSDTAAYIRAVMGGLFHAH
jgi:hypothetical protein